MSTIRAVVTSDNHLNRYYDRMPPQKLAERRRCLRRGFHAAVEAALSRPADLFLHAGDLFDTPDPRNVDREFVAEELARLRAAGVRVIGIAGNHDSPKQRADHGGGLPQGVYARLGGLVLLDGDGLPTEVVEVRGTRVAVGALPWSPSAIGGCDPLAEVDWAIDADVRVFLLHYGLEGNSYSRATEPLVARTSLERLEDAHLIVAGHVHYHDHWRLGRSTVLVPGATEWMTFGESGHPGFSVVDLSAGGVERLDHVRVACQERRKQTVDTTDLDVAGGEPCAEVLRRVDAASSPDAFFRLRLEGPISRDGYRALDLRRIWEFGVARNFYFDVDTSALLLADEFGSRPAGGVRISQSEELNACADELIAATDDPAERALLAEARQAVLASYDARATL